MSKSVLLISGQFPLYKKIKFILEKYEGKFELIAQIDNSVVGMSIIKELMPQIVVMRQKMHFWDAEHLIKDVAKSTIPVQYVILGDPRQPNNSFFEKNGAVSAVLMEDEISEKAFINALFAADKDWEKRYGITYSAHLMYMDSQMESDFSNNQAQEASLTKFAQGSRELVWVITACPIEYRKQSFYHYYPRLPQLFEKLHDLLEDYGGGVAGILQDQELCILLRATNTEKHPDWQTVCTRINMLMDYCEFPEVTLDISDEPREACNWEEAVKNLRKLHKYRFFVGDKTILQWEWIYKNRSEITQPQLKGTIDQLRKATISLKEDEVRSILQELYSEISASLSFELSNYAWNQLLILHSSIIQSYQLAEIHFLSSMLSNSAKNIKEMETAAQDMFLQLLREIRLNRTNEDGTIARVLGYLSENLGDALTLDDIAQEVHLNPSYLSRFIKKKTGKTFVRFLTELRIDKAKVLLNVGWKVGEAGAMVGFDNSKYFSQVFKKITGKTPREYKAALREENKRR